MNLAPVLKQQFIDANGNPIAGGFVYTYQANTLTPQVTYQDVDGDAENENPIELDASGRADIWLDPELSYKFVVKDASLVTVFTVDDVVGTLTADSVTEESLQAGCVTAEKLNTDAIHGQTQESNPAPADEFLLYDASAVALKRVTLATLLPPGIIVPYGGVAAPNGWLMCDGSSVSRATYAGLFAAIGTAFGSASGSTFNLPKGNGMFLRGVDDGAGVDPDAASRTAMASGGNTGDNVGSIQADATAKNALALTDPGHTHTPVAPVDTAGTNQANAQTGADFNVVTNATALTLNSNTTGITLGNGDSETRPVNMAVNYIIKY